MKFWQWLNIFIGTTSVLMTGYEVYTTGKFSFFTIISLYISLSIVYDGIKKLKEIKLENSKAD